MQNKVISKLRVYPVPESNTVDFGYNDVGYNETLVITNKF